MNQRLVIAVVVLVTLGIASIALLRGSDVAGVHASAPAALPRRRIRDIREVDVDGSSHVDRCAGGGWARRDRHRADDSQ